MGDVAEVKEALERLELFHDGTRDGCRACCRSEFCPEAVSMRAARRWVRMVEGLDYEAALAEYLKLRWAQDGLGPYAEELSDVTLENGVTVPRISNFEEAKRIVDAAVGVEKEKVTLRRRLRPLARILIQPTGHGTHWVHASRTACEMMLVLPWRRSGPGRQENECT